MKLANLALIAMGAVALGASPALAHHSGAMFDSAKDIVLDGTIKEFQWTNPHTWIQVNVPGANGGVDEWSVESGSPNLIGRQGWKRNSFKPGDKVTMHVHPLKNGQHGGSFVSATFADGHTLGGNRATPANPATNTPG